MFILLLSLVLINFSIIHKLLFLFFFKKLFLLTSREIKYYVEKIHPTDNVKMFLLFLLFLQKYILDIL